MNMIFKWEELQNLLKGKILITNNCELLKFKQWGIEESKKGLGKTAVG